MSVAECQMRVSSSEFVDWQTYIEQSLNDFHREDYFFAALITEVRRIFAKDPRRIKLEQALIKFQTGQRKADSVKDTTTKSKGFWLGLMKLAGKK